MAEKKKRRRRAGDERKLVLGADSPWAVQEAYKGLRTNVLFSLPGQESKVIGVTSALAHDGKSINAINHAISFAQINKKVMLIEADLRRPTISARLQVKGVPGLTDLLVGQAKLMDCVRRLPDYKLDLIPAGSMAPDPTWLLQSAQMKALLQALRKEYDFVIIDLPPVLSVADAAIVAPNLDGLVFVVRHNTTDVRAIRDALGQLKMADARIIGFLYNDAAGGEGSYYSHSYK